MLKFIPGTSLKAGRLLKQMADAGISEKDITEEFTASPGPGGQNVNKVATCVILRHGPSGRVIKCHKYRTQFANRVHARELLVDALENSRRKQAADAGRLKARERARRRGRSARGKENMLEQKRIRSMKKQSRRP